MPHAPLHPPGSQNLYLGESGLDPFPDARLYNYWTKQPMPEKMWMQGDPGKPPSIETRNATLWDLGNK